MVCKEISGKRYSKADNLLLCDNDYYRHNVFPVMLTLFCIVALVIPIILIYLVFNKYKNK